MRYSTGTSMIPVIYDIMSPAVIENAWSMNIAPAIPLINISGTNTAIVVSEELSIGVIISVVPMAQGRFSEYPFSRDCDMISVTIMALAIIIPTASISPDNDMTFSDI